MISLLAFYFDYAALSIDIVTFLRSLKAEEKIIASIFPIVNIVLLADDEQWWMNVWSYSSGKGIK